MNAGEERSQIKHFLVLKTKLYFKFLIEEVHDEQSENAIAI